MGGKETFLVERFMGTSSTWSIIFTAKVKHEAEAKYLDWKDKKRDWIIRLLTVHDQTFKVM